MSILSKPYFHNEEAAYEFVESKLWPQGATCPKCGERERVSKMQGKSTRIGAYKCYKCRKPFTVKVGTIFESSHVKMHLWLQAIYLMCASKKGVSANQLHRTLGVTLKTAWFMAHRIREAMKDDSLSSFGSGGGMVEVDETYMGKTRGYGKGAHSSKKRKVLALVDRETGRVRSMKIDNVTVKEIAPIVKMNLSREAQLMTDQAMHYRKIGKMFPAHHSVNHGLGEYVNKENGEIHTNTVENYFSVFKRGMKGIYQHCAEKHLNRYLAEYNHRYNYRAKNGYSDLERAEIVLMGVSGKRLTYERAGA